MWKHVSLYVSKMFFLSSYRPSNGRHGIAALSSPTSDHNITNANYFRRFCWRCRAAIVKAQTSRTTNNDQRIKVEVWSCSRAKEPEKKACHGFVRRRSSIMVQHPWPITHHPWWLIITDTQQILSRITDADTRVADRLIIRGLNWSLLRAVS